MIRPGANGSAAYFCSITTKRINRGIEVHREAMVMGADQATLLPRSSPRRSVKTASTRTKAPGKSIRANFVLQFELSILGK